MRPLKVCPLRSGRSPILALGLLAGGMCLPPAHVLALFPLDSSSPVDLHAQSPIPVQEAVIDSAALSAEARRAQDRFERVRRNNVPWARRSWSGPCDEIIGRFCIWHDGRSDWTPPPDNASIVRARDRLLEELEEVGARIPGDEWVLGQRIKYLGEADRWEAATRLAAVCDGGARWWCDALLGFSHHNSGKYEAAEIAFQRALEAMPDDRVEEWLDPTLLLDRDGQRWLERASANEVERRRGRIWWLGDPLYLIPGNERWTEHLSRRVMLEIQQDARNPHWLRWGNDLSEILVRFGWSIAWERIRPDPFSQLSSLSVVGRERPNSLRFIPPGDALGREDGIDTGDWRLDDPRPRSKYSSPNVTRVEELPHQLSLFRRGDSLLVVATFELPEDTGDARNAGGRGGAEGDTVGSDRVDVEELGIRVGFFLVPDFHPVGSEPPVAVRRTSPGARSAIAASNGAREGSGDDPGRSGVFVASAPSGRHIVSLEAWDPASATAWRVRRDLSAPAPVEGVPIAADLLLHRVDGSPPSSIEEAAERAFPSARVRRDHVVGVAWEIYELAPREALSFRITVEPESGGRLRRLGEWLGLVEGESPVELAWSEPGPDGAEPFFRSAELDLRALEPGRYTLRLEVGLRGRTPIVTTRMIELLPEAAASVDAPRRVP